MSCTTDGFIIDLNPSEYRLHEAKGAYGLSYSKARTAMGFSSVTTETKGVTVGLAS